MVLNPPDEDVAELLTYLRAQERSETMAGALATLRSIVRFAIS